MASLISFSKFEFFFWGGGGYSVNTYIVVAKVTLVSVVGVDVFPVKLHFSIRPAAFVLGAGGVVVVNSLSMPGKSTTS